MVLKLIREVFKVGEATLPYPFKPVEVAPGFRGRPQHHPELCMACAACTVACPSNALAMENDLENGVRTWSLFYGRCIYCARCEEVCPTGAITLTQDFELAVFRRQDLLVQADYTLAACRICGVFFAPAKELEYTWALLEQAGLLGEDPDQRRAVLETCPQCKRKAAVPHIVNLYQEAV